MTTCFPRPHRWMFVRVSPIEKESEEKSIRPPVTGLKRPSGPVFDGYLIPPGHT